MPDSRVRQPPGTASDTNTGSDPDSRRHPNVYACSGADANRHARSHAQSYAHSYANSYADAQPYAHSYADRARPCPFAVGGGCSLGCERS